MFVGSFLTRSLVVCDIITLKMRNGFITLVKDCTSLAVIAVDPALSCSQIGESWPIVSLETMSLF